MYGFLVAQNLLWIMNRSVKKLDTCDTSERTGGIVLYGAKQSIRLPLMAIVPIYIREQFAGERFCCLKAINQLTINW